MANGTLYVSLLFGWFYLWAAAPQGKLPEEGPYCHAAVEFADGVLVDPRRCSWFRRAVTDYGRGTDARLQSLLWIHRGWGLAHFLILVWVDGRPHH